MIGHMLLACMKLDRYQVAHVGKGVAAALHECGRPGTARLVNILLILHKYQADRHLPVAFSEKCIDMHLLAHPSASPSC